MGEQALVSLGELLGQNSRLRHDRNKAGVAGPTRQDMHVQVVIDPRAGHSAQVETEIESIRMVFVLQRSLTPLGHDEKIVKLLFGSIAEEGDVPVGDDQHVPGRVGKEVQDDEQRSAAEEEEVLPVLFARGDYAAENATGVSVIDPGYIVITPGRPQSVH